MNELLGWVFSAAMSQPNPMKDVIKNVALKPIASILGNTLAFERKYFDIDALLPGCKVYNIDEVLHNW